MKRCTAALPTTRSWQARRWASHDRSTLTPEALLEQVQAGLDEDTKVIPEQKKVSTPAGELPISPVFDPAWIKSRRRERKPAGAPVSGRFRKKLVSNPYDQTETQGSICKRGSKPSQRESHTEEPNNRFREDENPKTVTPWRSVTMRKQTKTRRELPLTIIVPREHPLPRTCGTATSAKQGKTVWRNDMGDFVLDKMRRVVVDALLARSDKNFGPQTKFMDDGHAVDDASAAALSSTTSEFATFDVDGAKYGSKMAVHDLYWLLGTTEVAKLKERRPHLFDEHGLVVLKGGRRMEITTKMDVKYSEMRTIDSWWSQL
ncbi:uncharacterized protein J7T54_002574 [Emericellopsis cladophorae]|uniref:Uncharacterized protein n=1 Tax=Emericellopsis cladophorae TaxID=2686198 RepID=A0A9Q0BCW0_9HYPO|nr:uncharacterized protein J7T54_002574 [Emericellopsis cladophorae]KAI6781217.1 hypothetical protein J7T54_002574 [Emericellopsis cladophorae]